MGLNRKVIVGLAVGVVALLVIAPNVFGRALPVLLLAACPLSMVVMMRSMRGTAHNGGEGSQGPAEDVAAPSEVVGLRAELDQLRAELDARANAAGSVRGSPPVDTDEAGGADRT